MTMKKSLAALAAVAVMGVTMVGATNIGIVNVGAIAQGTPSVVQGLQKVQAQYGPKVVAVQKAIDAEKTDAAKKAVLEKNKATLVEAEKARVAVLKPFYDKLGATIDKVKAANKVDVVIDGEVIAANKGDQVTDLTKMVYAAMK